MDEQRELNCTVLYHSPLGGAAEPLNTSGGGGIGLHRHAFWQLEVVFSDVVLMTPEGSEVVKSNTVLLLPPDTVHGFRYSNIGKGWFSVKFHLQGLIMPPEPIKVPGSAFTDSWIECLRRTLRVTSPDRLRPALGHLIGLLLITNLKWEDTASSLPSLVKRAIQLVESNARHAWSVAEIAAELGVSAGYLSAIFRKSQGVTLKHFIDQNRFDLACEMLRYADLSISQIGDQLSFADVYSFSRFFKSHHGKSPKYYRQASRADLDP